MIRTKEYIVVKSNIIPITNKIIGKWIPVKECRGIEKYSIKDAKEVLLDMRSGDIDGHSGKCLYKIMEICFCDLK